MIDAKIRSQLMGRLAGLGNFPKDNRDAIVDLQNALDAAENDGIAVAAVNWWIESHVMSPRPADLREFIWPENEKIEALRGGGKCGKCGGAGFTTIFKLVTYKGKSTTILKSEKLDPAMTLEARIAFRAKLPENQEILSGSAPCECLPSTHKVFTDTRAR